MVFSNIGYSTREAFHHFRRNWSTSFGAVVTIFLSLFIIGTFVLGSAMLSSIVGNVEDRVTIQAFLSDDALQEDVDALRTRIEGWDNVESVTYKSKDEALQEYKQTMTNRNAADAVCDDPDNVASSVQYGRETVERLFSVTNYIRIAALVLVALLAFVAFVFINNTIRLAIAARRREIAIERLVGASNSFIRGPFVMEGILEALFGAILAIGTLHCGMSYLVPKLESSLQFLSFEVPMNIVLQTYAGLLVIGLLLGLFGSAIAMRRFLKV